MTLRGDRKANSMPTQVRSTSTPEVDLIDQSYAPHQNN